MLYFLYFTQLYAEATTSGHGPILIPSVLFLLCCSPSLDREVPPNPTRTRALARARALTLTLTLSEHAAPAGR